MATVDERLAPNAEFDPLGAAFLADPHPVVIVLVGGLGSRASATAPTAGGATPRHGAVSRGTLVNVTIAPAPSIMSCAIVASFW
jgi:hypothetical protein